MRKQRERRRCGGGLRASGPVAGRVAAALLMGLFLALGGVVGGGAAMAQEAEPAAQAGSEPIFIKMEPFAVAVFGKRGINCSLDFAEQLLKEGHVAAVPGEAFGTSEHIRISYAASMNDLERGFDRIQKLVEELLAT